MDEFLHEVPDIADNAVVFVVAAIVSVVAVAVFYCGSVAEFVVSVVGV